MATLRSELRTIRFGVFEADLGTEELRKQGGRVGTSGMGVGSERTCGGGGIKGLRLKTACAPAHPAVGLELAVFWRTRPMPHLPRQPQPPATDRLDIVRQVGG